MKRIDKGSYSTSFATKSSKGTKRFKFDHYGMIDKNNQEKYNFLVIDCSDWRRWHLHTDGRVIPVGTRTTVPQKLLQEAITLLENLNSSTMLVVAQ